MALFMDLLLGGALGVLLVVSAIAYLGRRQERREQAEAVRERVRQVERERRRAEARPRMVHDLWRDDER